MKPFSAGAAAVTARARRPAHLSARLRLTFWYTGLFLVAGAILLTLNYFLVDRSLTQNRDEVRVAVANRLGVSPNDVKTSERGETEDVDDRALYRDVQRQIADDHLEHLLTQSGIALAAMALLSLGLGWLIAGRVLRPVHQMTTTARHLSESNLHERIDLDGPDDELKELADTFDAMLDRLETAFSAQRRFVADASHELRTPLSIIRAEVDVTLADPDATPGDLRAMAEAIRDATKRTERLIDSLLVLARSDAGRLASEPCDLAAMVRAAAERAAPAADARANWALISTSSPRSSTGIERSLNDWWRTSSTTPFCTIWIADGSRSRRVLTGTVFGCASRAAAATSTPNELTNCSNASTGWTMRATAPSLVSASDCRLSRRWSQPTKVTCGRSRSPPAASR